MNIVWLILAALAGIAAILIAVDMIRFGRAKHKAEHPKAGIADAGGLLYVQGGKTYYKMPKSGSIRKLADYEYDLRPGSPDMVEFTRIMNQAREEHLAEIKEAKVAAVQNMREVAKEEARDVE